MTFDAIEAEVIKSALTYASEEMGIAVRNSAYSPNIKERLDHSCALFDRRGRLIAQAEHIPVHLGSLPWGLSETLRTIAQENEVMRNGDMWVVNDPTCREHTSTTLPSFARSSLRECWPGTRPIRRITPTLAAWCRVRCRPMRPICLRKA